MFQKRGNAAKTGRKPREMRGFPISRKRSHNFGNYAETSPIEGGLRMKIYTIANQKGGIGKTTTAQALIEILRAKGFKVLGIDLDTQANLSAAMKQSGNGAADLIRGGDITAVIKDDFIAASFLVMPEAKKIKAFDLAGSLAKVAGLYDFVIIDTPPLIDTLTMGALLASDRLIITATTDSFSIAGAKEAIKAASSASKINKRFKGAGVLFVKYSARSILSRDLKEGFEKQARALGVSVYSSAIRESVAVREAQALRLPLIEHARNSNAIKDYRAFVAEILKEG